MQTIDLTVTRRFDTPVRQVWRAWSESELVKQWWGPQGFSCPGAEMDFREGGVSLVCMRPPEAFGGPDLYNTWAYSRIEPHERIEFVMDWGDSEGNRTDPETMGLPPGMPRDVRHLITFRSLGENETEMTVTEFGYTSQEVVDLSRQGLEQCLDKMALLLQGR